MPPDLTPSCHMGTILLKRKVTCLQSPNQVCEHGVPTPGAPSPPPPPPAEPLSGGNRTDSESAPGGLPANPGCGTAWGGPGRDYLHKQTGGGQPGRLAQHLPAAHNLGGPTPSPGNAAARRPRRGKIASRSSSLADW